MKRRSVGPLATLAFVAVVFAALLYLWQSQVVAPGGPGSTAFSQERAIATLSHLLQEDQPHPIGSPANAVVRDRIVEAFKALGYAPEIQSDFVCENEGWAVGCAKVENIIAVHKGSGGGKAVLAAAHYDSVDAGPGAGDDGSGVAILLELARAMAGAQTKNDVIFLITDGEEAGLWGARAFAKHHPLMAQVGMVLNVEARGASGASMMFETGPGNARLMSLFADAAARPVSNSLAYEVYKLLPNDTDFSVFRKLGLTGFNFAFSNSASLYHSRNDTVANLDRGSLQHQGDNAFAVAMVLADADLEALKSTKDASYFDVFGRTLVLWPAAWNVPLALAALVLLLGLAVVHRQAFGRMGVVWSVAALAGVTALLFALGWLLSFPLGIGPGAHPLDHPQPWPGRVALAAAIVLAPVVVAWVLRGRVEARALLLTNWIVIAGIAVAAAFTVTGVSYPFLWPALAVAVAGLVETVMGRSSLVVTAIVGFLGAAFFFVGFLLVLELVIGFGDSQFKLLAVLPLALSLVPLFAAASADGQRVWPAFAVAALVCAGAAPIASHHVPVYTPDHPRGLNVIYEDDGTAQRWLIEGVGPRDERYLAANGFPGADQSYRRWGIVDAKGRFKPATDQGLAAPSLTLGAHTTEDGATTVAAELRGARGGLLFGIGIAPKQGIRAIRVEGETLFTAEQAKLDQPVVVRFSGVGEREVRMEIVFDDGASPKVIVFERSALPETEEARALASARGPDTAPVHGGDGSFVYRTVDLNARP